MNKLILVGRLTRDTESRTTPGGTTLTKGGIAVDSYAGKDRDGQARTRTLFLDFVAFGATGENIAKHFRKGDPIGLEGELTYQTWEAKDGGGKRSKHEMIVEAFKFLPAPVDREDDEPAPPPRQAARRAPPKDVQDYGDVPF